MHSNQTSKGFKGWNVYNYWYTQKYVKLTRNQSILLILLEQAPSSNLSIHSHKRSAHMAGTPRNYWKVSRFMNLSGFPIKQRKNDRILWILTWMWIQSKWLGMPHLLRNQTPQPPAAQGVPGVQSITDRPQDMTKNTKKYQKLLVKSREHTSKQIPVKIVDLQIWWLTWSTSICTKWHFLHQKYW